MKVLVADDEPVSRRLLERYLQSWGYEVLTAADGEGAWALFQAQDIPLVISDWMMAELSGLELIRRMRGCERPGYVYLILLTSKTAKRDLVEGMEAGADDFVSKPFDPDELRVRVREGERIARLTRAWTEELAEALVRVHGADRGAQLAGRFRFPAAYRDDVPAAAAVSDVAHLDGLGAGELASDLVPARAHRGPLRFKLFRAEDPLPLCEVLPVLENLGVRVLDQRPYPVCSAGGATYWIHDYGLQPPAAALDTAAQRHNFQEAFSATWRGAAENDGFNRLVLRAPMSWGEVAILRTYARYLRQVGSPFSQAYMEDALAGNAGVARLLVDLFRARFDPARQGEAGEADGLAERVAAAIEVVASLDEDRILRRFAGLVLATVRTNWFRPPADGHAPEPMVVKLDPARVADLPLPAPVHEIFVCSPRVEGVHLRGGDVARGGIRHSDRREDFRVEVLALMRAQMVKNAVVVPVGAKGGFIVKAPPQERAALAGEVAACYRSFVGGLLELTDNIVDATVIHPPGVVVHDGADPYLVVAADKGTATFADLANALAAQYGFWLGDAFAAGGSTGYDHKAMGITARGVRESVKRHFLSLGIDPGREVVTVVGIGDMSGDVFGNAMLLSHTVRLVAAFDHRHIFLDPDPDPAAAHRERERLYRLPHSSWADYDPRAISPGGGVFPRDAKSIEWSAQVRRSLGVEALAGSGEDTIRAVLRAPVDLLFNGGVGTYVKAREQTHVEVADKANDAVRVDAADVRARVAAEGGNLGWTQRARVEYALRGGRIHTDAIDNSAGVDCSDREVNIKILLDTAMADGDLRPGQRNELLAAMTEEVAAMVLRDNYEQAAALALAVSVAPLMINVHARHLRQLDGILDRAAEVLPDDATLTRRRAAGGGLVAPELAVLLAQTKLDCYQRLLASDVAEDPWCRQQFADYFPGPLRARYAAAMARHPLRREIIASRLANSVVNRAGPSFLYRMEEATGAPLPELVRAHIAARRIFALDEVWAQIEALDRHAPAATQLEAFRAVRALGERGTLWLIRHRHPLQVEAVAGEFAAAAQTLTDLLPTVLPPSELASLEDAARAYQATGVPAPLARRLATLRWLDPALDLADLTSRTGRPVREAAATWFALGDQLGLDWLAERIETLPAEDRWQTLARHALREDHRSERAAMCAQALTAGSLDAWLAPRGDRARRLLAVIEDIRASGVADVTRLSVARREARSLARGT